MQQTAGMAESSRFILSVTHILTAIGLDLLSKGDGGVCFVINSINTNGPPAGSYSEQELCYVRCYARSDGGPSLRDLSNQSSSTIYLGIHYFS